MAFSTLVSVIWCSLLTVHLTKGSVFGLKNGKFVNELSSCTCPDYILTYECTVVGGPGGGTVWHGTAFNCTMSDDEIVLLHGRFHSDTRKTCNNETIVGQVLRVENNCYTSQLSIIVTSGMIGETIVCAHDNGTTDLDIIGSSVVLAATASYPSAPDEISVSFADFSSRQLIFNWNPVAPDCSAIHYNILTSNCGSCPTTTNHTTITCTDIPTDGSNCTLALQTVLCGNVIGNLSVRVQGVLKDTATSLMLGHTVIIVSASLFGTALIVCVANFITMIIILVRGKTKDHGLDRESAISTTPTASTCEHSMHQQSNPADIDTTRNIVYGHGHSPSVSSTVIDMQNDLYASIPV